MKPGVSFIVPVYNGAQTLPAVLRSILLQADERPFEIIVVDDGSQDDSPALARRAVPAGRLRLLQGPGWGTAAALNVGIAHARQPWVALVDQDVVLSRRWLAQLVEALEEAPDIGAAQGRYVTHGQDGMWARLEALDLEHRYAQISSPWVDHVCTGNAVYRREALRTVGGLDPSFGYGCDNDLSYRLTAAHYRLAFCPKAISRHRRPRGLWAYLRKQYGVGYGRLDLVAKHPRHLHGDMVSGPGMILHAGLTFLAVLLLSGAALARGSWAGPVALGAGVVLGALALERLVAGVRAADRFGDRAALWFPVAHLLRDLAWVAAIATWAGRRIVGLARQPSFSMPRACPSGAPPTPGHGQPDKPRGSASERPTVAC